MVNTRELRGTGQLTDIDCTFQFVPIDDTRVLVNDLLTSVNSVIEVCSVKSVFLKFLSICGLFRVDGDRVCVNEVK